MRLCFLTRYEDVLVLLDLTESRWTAALMLKSLQLEQAPDARVRSCKHHVKPCCGWSFWDVCT